MYGGLRKSNVGTGRNLKKVAREALNGKPHRYAISIAFLFERKYKQYIATKGFENVENNMNKKPIVVTANHIGPYLISWLLLSHSCPLKIIIYGEIYEKWQVVFDNLKNISTQGKIKQIELIKVPGITGFKKLMNAFINNEIIFFFHDTDIAITNRNRCSTQFLLNTIQLPTSILNLIVRYDAYFTVMNTMQPSKLNVNFTFTSINYSDEQSLIANYEYVLQKTEEQILKNPELWYLWIFRLSDK